MNDNEFKDLWKHLNVPLNGLAKQLSQLKDVSEVK